MRLSQFDRVATDPGSPFGGGVQPLGGGSQPGSGSAQEANPHHAGPPPAAAGASHIIRCNECGKVCNDGGELDEHMRKEHFVRQTLSSRNDDVTVPAALIFIDSLGDTLPFKRSFTFKELSDFCHREGVNLLSSDDLSEGDLLKIADNVSLLTNNHIEVVARPTQTADRTPLSEIDLNVAERAANREKTCQRCSARIAAHRVFCDSCRGEFARHGFPKSDTVIELYAHVTLEDGTRLHVVDIEGETYIGVTDLFESREFSARDAVTIHNLTDDLRTVEASRCDMCGEEVFEFSAKCANCGHARS